MNTHATIRTAPAPTPTDRETIAERLGRLDDSDRSFFALMMENPAQDDAFTEGLHRHLDLAAGSRLLNSLKLEQRGLWLGQTAPARLQIRLMEAARSSQHAAYQAFRSGLVRSGGLERAFPKV